MRTESSCLRLPALRIEVETPHTYQESVDLFRIGRREVDANPDGIDFSGPMFESMHLTGLFTARSRRMPTALPAARRNLPQGPTGCASAEIVRTLTGKAHCTGAAEGSMFWASLALRPFWWAAMIILMPRMSELSITSTEPMTLSATVVGFQMPLPSLEHVTADIASNLRGGGGS